MVKMGVPRQSSIPFTPPKFSYQESRSTVFAQLKPFQIDHHTNGIHGASVIGGWESKALCFYSLTDYPSSLEGDEEGDGGYPPSEGRKGRWDGSGGYIERATCRELNKHGD